MISLMALAILSGQLDPQVTQDNIHQTICVTGWSAAQRAKPLKADPYYYVKAKKKLSGGHIIPHTILDHKIAIEVGGSAVNPVNMQIQTVKDAARKDQLENYVNRRVCANRMSLSTAQALLNNWTPLTGKPQ